MIRPSTVEPLLPTLEQMCETGAKLGQRVRTTPLRLSRG